MSLMAAAGYAWLLMNLFHVLGNSETMSLCPLKNVAGIPCPSCGTTRSALLILEGDIAGGFMINPLGATAILALVVVPIWLLKDVAFNTSGFFHFYQRAENLLRKTHVALPVIGLVALNWIWNIYKNL